MNLTFFFLFVDEKSEEPLLSENVLSGWEIRTLFYQIFDLVMKQKEEHLFQHSIWQNRNHFSTSDIDLLFKRILFKWILFLRVAARIIQRCDLELFTLLQWIHISKIESIDHLTNENVVNAIESFRLKELFYLSNENEISFFNIISIWLKDRYRNNVNYESLSSKKLTYPTQKIPTFLELPHSYTKLHSFITSKCNYEYPAICYICGEILDAGMIFL